VRPGVKGGVIVLGINPRTGEEKVHMRPEVGDRVGCQRDGGDRVRVHFGLAVWKSLSVHRCFRNAGPPTQCLLATAEHQHPGKKRAGHGGRRPRRSAPRRRRAPTCTGSCVAGAGGRVGRHRGGGRGAQQQLGSPSFSCTGVGAPRAAGPGAGLLGWAALDRVRGHSHGCGHLAGGGTLLDRTWARPVRAARAVTAGGWTSG
jgi:hypothetical protein